MDRWESLVDRLIIDAIGNGDISHLPGAGKPLQLNNDANTPEDMRLAFKIMKDNDVVPDWLIAGQALDQLQEKLREQLIARVWHYSRQLSDAKHKHAILLEHGVQDEWQIYVAGFKDRVGRYNKEVNLYNLKVPHNFPHKQMLIADREIEKALAKVTQGNE